MDAFALTALIFSIIALCLSLLALGNRCSCRREGAPGAPNAGADAGVEPGQDSAAGQGENRGPVYIVFNPTKSGLNDEYRKRVSQVATDLGMGEPIWLATEEDDPGYGQCRQALEGGASVVLAAGGDGTVRAVASVLAGTSVPLGIIPVGTGNLYARNLELPLDLEEAVMAALSRPNRTVDLAYLRWSHQGQSGTEPFLVMSGLGFDAQTMATTDPKLKKKIGWLAYVIAGAKHLYSGKFYARVRLGQEGQVEQVSGRSLLFANCGKLVGGVVLVPDAEPDDGWLDVVAFDTKGGPIGWMLLGGKVLMQAIFSRRHPSTPFGMAAIAQRRTNRIEVRLSRPEQLQVDGDAIGEASALRVEIQPGVLQVRA